MTIVLPAPIREQIAALDAEIDRLKNELAHKDFYIQQLDHWHDAGEQIIFNAKVGWRFRAGEWWADRPWRKRP